MGWQDAPVVGETPAWMQAPAISSASEKAAIAPAVQIPSQDTGIMGGLGNMLYGGVKGAADLVQGPAQLVLHGATALANAGNSKPGPSVKWLNNISNQFDKHLTNQEAQYQAETPGSIAAGAGRIAAGVAPFLASGGSSAAPQASSLFGRMGTAAIQGGAFAGSNPVLNATQDNFAGEKGKQVALGSVLSGAAVPVASLAARLISPNVAPEVKTLIDAGVTPTPGQIMGGGWKRAEEAMTSVPVLGDFIKNAQLRAAGDLNTAAINRALTPIKDSVPSGVVGRDAIEYAGKKLGAAYETVLNKIGAVVPDAKFGQDLSSLSQLTQNLPSQTTEQFNRIIQNEIIGRIKNGAITSDGLKAAESNLGSIARGSMKSPDYDSRMMGAAIQEAQSVLRNMVERTSPSNAAELKAVNTGWANFMRPQRAASSLGAESGVFTPAQLQNAVKSLDSSRNKGAFARGDALMQDLSEAGKNVLGNKLPDSGTPYRHALQAAVGAVAGHTVLPAAASGMIIPAAGAVGAASIPYTQMGQKIAAALLAKRPDMAPTIANAIKQSGGVAGISITPAFINALTNGSN